jgi:phage terminase small subunit
VVKTLGKQCLDTVCHLTRTKNSIFQINQQMAGVKGKSGGPRKNSGGVRAGAGRPKKQKQSLVPIDECDMLKLLQDIALGRVAATTVQVRAAIAAVQYTHTKKADGGKKEEQADKAHKAASKFTQTSAPLKLIKPTKFFQP